MADERVLIVDDEPEMVENLTRILRREGYRCLSATESRKAAPSQAARTAARDAGAAEFFAKPFEAAALAACVRALAS